MDTLAQTYESSPDFAVVKATYKTTKRRKPVTVILPKKVLLQKTETYISKAKEIASISEDYTVGKNAEATKVTSKRFDIILISFLYLAGLSGLVIGLITNEIYYPIVGILGSIVASLHLYGLKEKIE